MKKNIVTKAIVPIVVMAAIMLIPAPAGLETSAWRFFGLFIGVILGLVFEPLPAAAIGLIGITIADVFKMVHVPGKEISAADSLKWALSGFSNSTVWLIFAAFMFSLGYKKTGLGRRISLILIRYMGKSTLGLGYAISFGDLILAPFIPSNSARSGGTIYPIVSNIPPMFDSYPDKNPKRIGSYLSWVALANDCVTSSMFLTSLAPTVLATSILKDQFKINFEWMPWFLKVGLICIPLFLLVPLISYWIYPPEVKRSPEVVDWAKKELAGMKSMSIKEILLLVFVIVALVLWIFGKHIGIDATTAALIVVSLMVIFGVLSWDDIISDKSAWSVFAWFATMVALASALKTVGILDWIAKLSGSLLSGLAPNTFILILCLVFVLIHYLFASSTAHVTALLPLFMNLGISVLPPEYVSKFALIITGGLGLMGVITPYGTGPSPIWYGSGYLPQKDWWFLGFIFLIIFFVVYLPYGMIFF